MPQECAIRRLPTPSSSLRVPADSSAELSFARILSHTQSPEFPKAIRACRVTGKRGVPCRFKGKHSSKVTRLIGRDQELQRLLALWDRAKHGEGQVGLISGEAGIGKSHLCEFLLGHLVEPHATLRYQCSPHHLNSPFYPVVSQLEHAMGFEQADTPALKFEKLKVALSQAVDPTREDVLLYAALLSISAPEGEAALDLTPQRQKDLTIAALSRHLLRLADKQPLIVALADAHWVNSSTLELVNRIIPLIKTARVRFAHKLPARIRAAMAKRTACHDR